MAADVQVLNNVEKLKSLLDDPCNCLEIVTQTIQFQLPSYFSEDAIRGIREMLNMELKRYSSRWQGNAMAYENVRLRQRGASFMGDLPFMAVEATVDFIVFRPKIGSTLRGIVNKISRDHIGCLILGCFNASLFRSQDDDDNNWDSPVVKIGSSVLLEVTAMNISGKVTFIRGRLLQVDDDQGNLNESVQSFPGDDDGYVSERQPSLPSVSSVEDIFQKPEAIYKKPVKKYFNDDELDAESQNESPKKKSKTSQSKNDHNSLNKSSGNKLADEQFQKLKKKTKGERLSESDTSVDLFITQTPSQSHVTASSSCSEPEDEHDGNNSSQAEVSTLSVTHIADDDSPSTGDFPDDRKSTKNKKKMTRKKEKDDKSKKKQSKLKKTSRDFNYDVSATLTEDGIKSPNSFKSPVQAVSTIGDSFNNIIDDKNEKSKRKSKDRIEVKYEFGFSSIYSTINSMTEEQTDLDYNGSGLSTPPKLKKKIKSEPGIRIEPITTSTPFTEGGNFITSLSTDRDSIDVIKTDTKVTGKRKLKTEDTPKAVKRLKTITEDQSSEHNSLGLESRLFQHDTSAHSKTATKIGIKKKRKDSSATDSGNSTSLPNSSSIKKDAEKGANGFPVIFKVESKDFHSDDEEVLEVMNLEDGQKGFAMAIKSFSSSKTEPKTPKKTNKDKKQKCKKKKKKKEESKDKKKKKEESKDKKRKKKNEESEDKKKLRQQKTSSHRLSSSKKHKIKKEPG